MNNKIFDNAESFLFENDLDYFENFEPEYVDAFDHLVDREPVEEYYFDALPHMSFEAFAEEFGYQPE